MSAAISQCHAVACDASAAREMRGRNAEQKRVSVMLPRSQDLQLLPEGVNTTEGFRV